MLIKKNTTIDVTIKKRQEMWLDDEHDDFGVYTCIVKMC